MHLQIYINDLKREQMVLYCEMQERILAVGEHKIDAYLQALSDTNMYTPEKVAKIYLPNGHEKFEKMGFTE